MPCEFSGLKGLFSLKFQEFISPPKIFRIMKANGFALSACQCKETRGNYEDDFGKNNKKGNLKLD